MAKAGAIQRFLPLAATLFIVFGVVAVVLSRPKQEEISTPFIVLTTATTGTVTVLEGPGTAWIFIEGQEPRACGLPSGAARIARVAQEGITVMNGAGQNITMGFDCAPQHTTSSVGRLNPSGLRGARISADAGFILFSDGTNEEKVVLRDASSQTYHDPIIIGWMDDAHLAVVAFRGDSRAVLSVESTGRVTRLAVLPETAEVFDVASNAFWYVTATPGEGIEFGPRGPSELHRVDAAGKDEVVAGDENVFEALSAGPGGRFAVRTGGSLIAGTLGATRNIGTGTPLGWMENGTLLLVRNGHLVLVEPNRAPNEIATETTIAVPDTVTHAWRFSLDVDSPKE